MKHGTEEKKPYELVRLVERPIERLERSPTGPTVVAGKWRRRFRSQNTHGLEKIWSSFGSFGDGGPRFESSRAQ
jgi:hypothetical protein